MVCFKCDSEKFKLSFKSIEQCYKSKHLVVHEVEVTECIECGWFCLDSGQGTKLYNQTKERYNEIYGPEGNP